MTRAEKITVAKELTSNRLMDLLVEYGKHIEGNKNGLGGNLKELEETIEVIKAELGDRLAGL